MEYIMSKETPPLPLLSNIINGETPLITLTIGYYFKKRVTPFLYHRLLSKKSNPLPLYHRKGLKSVVFFCFSFDF